VSVDVAVGPYALDGFTAVDDQVCDFTLEVTDTAGRTMLLACEVEGGHDEHEATLRWTAGEPDDE
jgi:hypothetical protein